MPKVKTLQQWRYLLSKASPLTAAQKKKMIAERRAGKITITRSKRKAKKK